MSKLLPRLHPSELERAPHACPFLSHSHGHSRRSCCKMPRLPLIVRSTLLHRAEALCLTKSPSRLTPAYPPRISAVLTRRNFYFTSPSQKFTATPTHRDRYTPTRRPNAAWPYLYRAFDNMANLDPYFQQVDSLQDKFIDRLREAVAIPSISSEDQRRPDVVKVRPASFVRFPLNQH